MKFLSHAVLFLAVLAVCLIGRAHGGLLTIGACYSACNASYVTCMGGWGLVAGTTGPVGWTAWLFSGAAGCSAAQGACMAACVALTP